MADKFQIHKSALLVYPTEWAMGEEKQCHAVEVIPMVFFSVNVFTLIGEG